MYKQAHGVDKLGLWGYSHGGGSVWLVTAYLQALRVGGTVGNDEVAIDGDFRDAFEASSGLLWTGYVDAVHLTQPINPDNPVGGLNRNAERRLPYLTPHHFNRWQGDDHGIMPYGAETTEAADGTPWDAENPPPQNVAFDQNDTDDGVNDAASWEGGSDHTDDDGRGIAENVDVQSHLVESARAAMGGPGQ